MQGWGQGSAEVLQAAVWRELRMLRLPQDLPEATEVLSSATASAQLLVQREGQAAIQQQVLLDDPSRSAYWAKSGLSVHCELCTENCFRSMSHSFVVQRQARQQQEVMLRIAQPTLLRH